MTAFDNIFASIFAVDGHPVWGIVIRSTIVVALAALACALLRRRSAAVRHRVWVFGLAASLVVPLASLLLPKITLHALPGAADSSGLAITQNHGQSPPASAAESNWPVSTGGIKGNGLIPQPEPNAQTNTAIAPMTPLAVREPEELSPASAGSPEFGQVLVFCWLLGTACGSTLFLISLTRQSRQLSRLRKIEDDDWQNSVTTAATALGIRRPIVTLESDEACVPAVVGILHPRLLVPRDWRTWRPAQRHCILLHELAHVKRRDVLAQLLGRVALLVHWFNPLIWHAVRRLRAERELASDDCVLLTGQTASDYAEQLLQTLRCYRPVRSALGVAMAHSARIDLRVLAILDPRRHRNPVGTRFAVVLTCIVGFLCTAIGGVTLSTRPAVADPSPASNAALPARVAGPVWKENYAINYPGTLPVSVTFSEDGKMLLTGDTGGEVMALVFPGDTANWRWKTKVKGSHAAVAFSADRKTVYATTEDGVRILDAATGKAEDLIEAKGRKPTAIGVFPDKTIAATFVRSQIVFGNPRGYFVKSWAQGKLATTAGTIQTSTVGPGAKPADETAVPLAVDPKGRSAIMRGPIDATGKVGGVKGKNVLWAYVCGDYGTGSPGNRVMPGHSATVVSAAWAENGDTAVTGDAAGRVIVWNAKTMKETGRLELGGRVAALAISAGGTRTAAYVLGKRGRVFVWETAKPKKKMPPIHTESGDFSGPATYASLSFSPDGKRLAGCAINKKWQSRLGELVGKVRVWELAGAPKAQLPPKHLYSKKLAKGSSSNFVILNNHSILMPVPQKGAVDFRSIADGGIQARLVLGKYVIGGMKLSTDRRWLAMEQHAQVPAGVLLPPSRTFDVGVWDMKTMKQHATILACSRMLDVAAGGKAVAVVRNKQIELWGVATPKLLKKAPFTSTRIDAARFSPDGRLLAISDRNTLVFWQWEDGKHQRIKLGRSVGSLTFSPDGRFLAEGPTPRANIQVRDVASRRVVRTLTNAARRSMNVPVMAYSQGGRVLIACDNITFTKNISVPHRIDLWDMADGSLAHQLAIPAGLPQSLGVSPNGRYLVTIVEENGGRRLSVWRLDGKAPVRKPGPRPPATEGSR
jgi:beta-lactamase regulating signal transducer with metallopeptidase domain/WD40 repeat protein